MKYIKGGLRVLADYAISLLLFVIFLYVFISITKDNYSTWIPLYSFLFFLLMFSMIYSDFKKTAIKEKRPQYDLNPYPLKGLVYGIIGFIPVAVVELIYPFIVFNTDAANRIKELVLKTLLGPVYFAVRIGGGTTAAYIIASLIVPVLAMLGYLAGFYGFELRKTRKKVPPQKKDKKP